VDDLLGLGAVWAVESERLLVDAVEEDGALEELLLG